MTELRTTVIMKTDVSGSTMRFRALAAPDLHALLLDHREFLSRHAAAHGGRIVKPEGDGFWLVFPAVTAAALAAMAMQEELRFAQPNTGDERLCMRIVITVGDVLHEEGALVGDAVVLTTRIESITPPDEIYLSAAAWLAANRAELRTALVDTVTLKGFPEPVTIYRIEQTHRTRILTDQCVVRTDLRGFINIRNTAPTTTVEKILETLFGLIHRAAKEFSGTVRFGAGDGYCLTFADPGRAMAAAARVSEGWTAFLDEEKLPCPVNVAVHQGTLYAFRSYLYGPGIETAFHVEVASHAVLGPHEGGVFVTEDVRKHLAGTVWDSRLVVAGIPPSPRLATTAIYRLRQAEQDS
jgi:class 3 adenylate cyclase